MQRNLGKSVTEIRYLAGCGIKNLSFFLDEVQKKKNGWSSATLDYLGRNYGTEYEAVLKLAKEDKSWSEVINEDGEIPAQVVYAIRQEMARTLPDIVMRRTGIGTLGNPGENVLLKVAQIAAGELKWDRDRMEKEIADTVNLLKLPA